MSVSLSISQLVQNKASYFSAITAAIDCFNMKVDVDACTDDEKAMVEAQFTAVFDLAETFHCAGTVVVCIDHNDH